MELNFGHLIPENHQKSAVNGIEICCDCGEVETTVLTYGIYCQPCRKFRHFIKKLTTTYQPTGTTLDLD
jgi:hypothetical protein